MAADRAALPASAWPAAALVFNALVWGVSWWPFRALQERGLHPLLATALVFGLSFLCVLAARPGAWRGVLPQPLLWALGLGAGLTNAGFNWAVTTGDVVRVVLLFYLMPAWSVLLAWPLLGEKPSAARLARVALALAGVAVVLQAGGMAWPWPSGAADWLALAGGLSFAVTSILLRKLRHEAAPARVLAMFGGGALVAALGSAAAASQGLLALPASLAWPAPLIALGLALAFLLSNAALQFGAARLNAHATSLIMLSEVLFASVSSVALGAGALTPRIAVGGGLILLAAAWSAWEG